MFELKRVQLPDTQLSLWEYYAFVLLWVKLKQLTIACDADILVHNDIILLCRSTQHSSEFMNMSRYQSIQGICCWLNKLENYFYIGLDNLAIGTR